MFRTSGRIPWTVCMVSVFMAIISPVAFAQSGNELLNRMDRKAAEKKLLEFVSPQYQSPLVSQQLVAALANPPPGASTSQQKSAESIAESTAGILEAERMARRNEQLMRMQIMQGMGLETPGLNSQKNASSMASKVDELRQKILVRKVRLKDEQQYRLFTAAMRKMAAESSLQAVKVAEIRATSVKSGYFLNTFLTSLKPALTKLTPQDPVMRELDYLDLRKEDFAKIRLQLDLEGEPVIFAVTEGTSDSGKPPTCMMRPELQPHVERVQNILKELAMLSEGPELYRKIVELGQSLQELDDACDRTIGTARQCATQGVQQHRIWKTSKTYRDRIRGVLNQLEIGDSPEILSIKGYDPEVEGTRVLSFIRFVYESGCRFAPARNGDEAAYVRLMERLVQLQSLFEQAGLIEARYIDESKLSELELDKDSR